MSAIPITFYSLREAATGLGVDYCTARGLLVNGQLRGFQIGRRWRVQHVDHKSDHSQTLVAEA